MIERAGLTGAIEIDSAGTGAWHVGEPADDRARAAAQRRGFELTSLARQVKRADFARFDYLVAMDEENLRALERLAPDQAARGKVRLLRSFDRSAPRGAAVPDPYYGGDDGFEEVLDICEAACRGLVDHIAREHGLR